MMGILTWITGHRLISGVITGVIAGLIVAALFFLFGKVFVTPTTVAITSPVHGSEMVWSDTGLLVTGTHSGIKNGQQIYVLVHPLPTDHWWVQRVPVTTDGNWQTTVYLGEENVGYGDLYQVRAIITNKTLSVGQKIQLTKFPPYVAQDMVELQRKETPPPETVSTPSVPSGLSSGNIDQPLTYSSGGASSNLGHSLQYRFDWGDGAYSSWSSSSTASHSWSSANIYTVRAQARCSTHTSVTSSWSSGKSVTIESTEAISVPSTPSGPSSGNIDQPLTYSSGGASSNLGHSLQYRFDWGDGAYSSWSSSSTASHSWSSANIYTVRAQARCSTHTSVTSSWSSGKSVTISPAVETVSTPSVPSGPSSGEVRQTLTYTTAGSSSNLGYSVQYHFNWDDGTDSSWSPSNSAFHFWANPGSYTVTVQARSSMNTDVLSSWSASKSVTISAVLGWSVSREGNIVEIAYGSGSHFPQFAALHLDSGFFRMNYGPESSWGTSIMVVPSFWEGGTLYQGAPVSSTWEIVDSNLVLSIDGTISGLNVNGEIRLSPPTDDSISATVMIEVDGDVELDDRPGEAFKLVTLASMHISSDLWDAQSAFAGSNWITIPTSSWILDPPVTDRLFGLQGGTSGWKVNAPTIAVSLDRDVAITGWVTPSNDPNDDNVAFWGALETVVPSWQYTVTARP